jgi:hypothetical protein
LYAGNANQPFASKTQRCAIWHDRTRSQHGKIAVVYERYDEPLLSLGGFLRRVFLHGMAAIGLLAIPLLVGIVGYMGLASLSPVNAFLNASMILGGMGPVDPLPTDAAKIFAGIYALFAGVFYLVVAGVIIAPFLHRVLHRLHVADGGDSGGGQGGG